MIPTCTSMTSNAVPLFTNLSSFGFPEFLAQVLVSAVGEDRHHDARLDPRGNLQSGCQSRSCRHPNKQAFFSTEPSGVVVRRLGSYFEILIRELRIIDPGDYRRGNGL